jgi:protein TonB
MLSVRHSLSIPTLPFVVAAAGMFTGCTTVTPRHTHPPEYLTKQAIRYPPLAANNGMEGSVIIRIKIDKQGKVRAMQIDKSSGSALLDSAALESVSNWTLKPARRKDGKPVSSTVRIPIRFSIPKSPAVIPF